MSSFWAKNRNKAPKLSLCQSQKDSQRWGGGGENVQTVTNSIKPRDEEPVLAKNRIRGSVPQTKGDFKSIG